MYAWELLGVAGSFLGNVVLICLSQCHSSALVTAVTKRSVATEFPRDFSREIHDITTTTLKWSESETGRAVGLRRP